MTRHLAPRVIAYALAAVGGIIYARQWDQAALVWSVLVGVYLAIIVDGRLIGTAPARPRP